jgi:ATP-dependent protease ClpP protease subunit
MTSASVMAYDITNKRKHCDLNYNCKTIVTSASKLHDKYYNVLNCDKIVLLDNHIYFDSLINNESITCLINFINSIIKVKYLFSANDFKIYIHINSKGGLFYELMNFVNYRNQCIYEIVSIIDKECYDSGFVLAALCGYRIITKNAKVYLSKIQCDVQNNIYWNYFKQCSQENSEDFKNLLYDVLCVKVESNLTPEKLNHYLNDNEQTIWCWNSKKYTKLGFADEIL